jgi:hypothetical protein
MVDVLINNLTKVRKINAYELAETLHFSTLIQESILRSELCIIKIMSANKLVYLTIPIW